MGAFSVLTSAISKTMKVGDIQDDNISRMSRMLHSTKAITERAKMSVFVYPVLFSEYFLGTDDTIKLVSKFKKYMEIQYGVFTMLTIGLNPTVDGDIYTYVKELGGEESYEQKFDDYKKQTTMIFGIESMPLSEAKSKFEEFLYENKSFNKEYSFSTEAIDVSKKEFNKATEKITEASRHAADEVNMNTESIVGKYSKGLHKDYLTRSKAIKEDLTKLNKNLEGMDDLKKDYERMKNSYEKDMIGYAANAMSDDEFEGLAGRVETKELKSPPAIYTAHLKMKGYANDVEVPMSIKCNPHFVRSNDLALLFNSAMEDKRILTRIVKLTSGEISFFKDFLLSLDKIKRDQRLYNTFGEHPWYRQFINRKENNKAKRAGIIISNIFSLGKEYATLSKSNYLPTTSIVLTKEELESGMGLKLGYMLKNEKILKDILERLGLLAIAIYDPTLKIFRIRYNGMKEVFTVTEKDLKGEEKDGTAELAKAMQMMVQRGM